MFLTEERGLVEFGFAEGMAAPVGEGNLILAVVVESFLTDFLADQFYAFPLKLRGKHSTQRGTSIRSTSKWLRTS